MTPVGDDITRIAATGSRLFEKAGPQHSAEDIRHDVRRAIRRRRALAAGAGIVVASLLVAAVVIVIPKIGGRDVEPATPVPGDLVWSSDVGSEMWGGPLLLDGRIYVGADDGTVRAFDAGTGAPAWTLDAGAPVRANLTTNGDLIFVTTDANDVMALRDNGSTAQAVWSVTVATRTETRGLYDTFGSAATVAGDVLVVGAADGGIHGLDLATGAERWVVRTGGVVRSTAAVADGVAYVGSNDGRLYAISVATGEKLWMYSLGGSVTPSPLVSNGLVIVGSRGTDVVAIDVATGLERWSYSLAPSWAESSPVPLGDMIVFGSSSAGTVTAVDAATGAERWTSLVGGWPWSRPAIADGDVYVTTAGTGTTVTGTPGIRALDGATGDMLWGAPIGTALRWDPSGLATGALANPVVTGGYVYVAGLDGVLYCFLR